MPLSASLPFRRHAGRRRLELPEITLPRITMPEIELRRVDLGAITLPRMAGRRSHATALHRPSGETIATGAALALLGIGLGIGIQRLRRKATPEAEHEVLERDGAFSIRRYRPMTVAQVRRDGLMTEAMDAGFTPLADYIHARPGSRADTEADARPRRLPMMAPVIVAPTGVSGSWAIRFVMPQDRRGNDLPAPGDDITLEKLPGRCVAAIRFSGKGTDRALVADKHRELMNWLARRRLKAASEPEFAAYDPPFVPGILRRNEWWVEIEGPAG